MTSFDQPARFPGIPCPMCGGTIDAASEVRGVKAMPIDGDYCLCVGCCEPAIYTVGALGLGLRKPTPEERGTIFKEHGYEIALMQEIRRGSDG